MSRLWLTGASSGLGAALAEQLLAEGHRLAVTARQAAPLHELAERFGDRVLVVPGDIADSGQVRDILQRIEQDWGALDRVILNAGTCEYLEPGAFSAALVQRVLTTNVLGTAHCIEACLPLLRRGAQPHLVVVGSAVTWLALPRAGAYGASKAALRYLLESLRIDLAGEGIDVTLVSPGFVDTPLTRRNDFPMPVLWPAPRAAGHIVARLDSRPLEIAFPRRFVLALRLLGALPASWRLGLGRRLARRPTEA
ncbi:NAD(P)-dependent dehydrogenase (short-subunit alcohol dehydrogenase family) [Pseudomonas nitritireducens]|uniref:NAD(P)-dependent dehydrogenase (Short-subunit alcohol dehydrogenase family) n=1 Tax=Pseudomonas nitroreducens TaxID=46680 RepID=A0A7W7KH59_PSENT|nr:SDR family NAD(P)-dependent oxidoreductase [Pseudomonas nitritireducens]MBB4862153.1 NAD(P)-dependent dehydrogenase (short-subunit alcohol dehydrogenase family) [Pseudomonas nitritireducens]